VARRVVLAVSVAVLAGCASAGTPASVIPATPSVDPFTDALVATRTWAAAQADIEVVQVVDGTVQRDRASGALGLDKGVGTLTWTDGREDAIDHRGPRARPPGGDWSPSAPVALIRPLAGLAGLQLAGDDRVGGVDAQRFEGDEPVTAETVAGLALPPDVADRVVRTARAGDRIQVTAWIDPYRRLVRLDRSLTAGTVQALVTTSLSDFGRFVDLTTPQ
jgi:hypothetical protein